MASVLSSNGGRAGNGASAGAGGGSVRAPMASVQARQPLGPSFVQNTAAAYATGNSNVVRKPSLTTAGGYTVHVRNGGGKGTSSANPSTGVNASRKPPPPPTASAVAATATTAHTSASATAAAGTATSTAKRPSNSATSTASAPTTQAQAPPPQQNRPATRLEREKKKDFSDPEEIGPYKLGKLIGTGASGRVRIAHHKKDGSMAAIKIIPKPRVQAHKHGANPEEQARVKKLELGIEREIIVMKLINHENLLSLIDVYETKQVLYLIMEFVEGGELFDHLVACGRLEVDQARNYFRQIMFGVDHCHSFNICHRDLKPENLLLSKDKSMVKVADFGMAALQHSGHLLETSCGSPHYASPEIVSGKKYVGTATDIWSCGIILFALLCGKLPFDDPQMNILLQKVKEGKFEMPKHLRDEAAKDLISKMLVVDPAKRYTMKQIFAHEWFTDSGRLSSKNPTIIQTDTEPVYLPHDDPESDETFHGLTFLFNGTPKEVLLQQLEEPGFTWPKRFFKLLKMRQDGGDDEGVLSRHSPVTQRHDKIKAAPADKSANVTPQATRVVQSSSPDKSTPTATANQAQSKTRTPNLNRRSSADAYSSPSARAAAQAALDADAAARGSPKAGPTRTLTDPARPNTLRHRASADNARVVPQITLRHATPGQDSAKERSQSPARVQRNGSLRANDGNSRGPSRPASPDKGSRPSSSLSQDPASVAIQVPSAGDVAIQRFFQEMADELASIRATGTEGARADRLQAKLDQARTTGWLSPASLGATSPPALSPDTRFDDAEDDRSEAGSYRSGTDSSSPYTPTSPLPPILYTDATGPRGAPVAPLSIPDKGRKLPDAPKRISQVSTDSQRNSMLSTRSSARRSAVSQRPASVFSNATSASNEYSRPGSMVQQGSEDLNALPYEQTRRGPAPTNLSIDKAGTMGKTGLTRLQQKNPGLGLDIPQASATVESPLASASSAHSSDFSSPRQASWFGSIFNWKPSVHTLWSVENLTITVDTCKQLLHSFGVIVEVENSEHHPTLKCSAIEIKDPQGRATSSKHVRFRVEFQVLSIGSTSSGMASPARLSVASPVPSFATDSSSGSRHRSGSVKASSVQSMAASNGVYSVKVKVTQEKGSNSSLKYIFSRLREDWPLGALDRSPKSSSVYSSSPNM